MQTPSAPTWSSANSMHPCLTSLSGPGRNRALMTLPKIHENNTTTIRTNGINSSINTFAILCAHVLNHLRPISTLLWAPVAIMPSWTVRSDLIPTLSGGFAWSPYCPSKTFQDWAYTQNMPVYTILYVCDCVCIHKHITLTYVYEQSNSDIMPHSIFCSFHTKSTEPPSSHPASPVLALLSHAHQREFLTIRLAHLIEFSRGKVDSEGPPCLENVKIRLKMVIPIPMDPNWLFTFL